MKQVEQKVATEPSFLWKTLSDSLFATIDDAFIARFRSPGGANNRLAAWDPLDRSMRYFKFLLYGAVTHQPERFFDLYRKLGDTNLGDPATVRLRGCDINIDYFLSVDEFLFLEKSIDMSEMKSVVEIGAGFGRTAHALLALAPAIEKYYIVDLPNMLKLSQHFLKATIPEMFGRIEFIDAGDVDSWHGLTSDIAINVDSFQEMPTETIDAYRVGILSRASYVYIKNPICKYEAKSVGVIVNDLDQLNDALTLGYCREILDIFNDEVLAGARQKYIDAYRPDASYQDVANEPLCVFPYLHHVLYRGSNAVRARVVSP